MFVVWIHRIKYCKFNDRLTVDHFCLSLKYIFQQKPETLYQNVSVNQFVFMTLYNKIITHPFIISAPFLLKYFTLAYSLATGGGGACPRE